MPCNTPVGRLGEIAEPFLIIFYHIILAVHHSYHLLILILLKVDELLGNVGLSINVLSVGILSPIHLSAIQQNHILMLLDECCDFVVVVLNDGLGNGVLLLLLRPQPPLHFGNPLLQLACLIFL